MNRQRFLLHALVVLTLARLCLLPLTELAPVESHAALCSLRSDLWHPMTGPVLPLLMRLSTAVFGWNEFGVRFFAPFLMLGAGWLVWKMAHGLFDPTTAAWATVLFQATPAVNVASVTFSNTTLGIAEGAALLVLLRLALHRPMTYQLHWWAVAGMSLLALFTDWRLIVFIIAGTGSLLLTRRGRTALLKWPVLPILGGSLAVGLLFFLAWNSERGWAAFHFPPMDSSAATTLWHSGLLAYGPPLLLLLGWALMDATLQRPLIYAPAFLLAFAWPLISLDVFSIHTTPWPQVGFAAWLPAAVILASAQLMLTERMTMRSKVWIRSIGILAAGIQSCLVLQPDLTRAFGWRWKFDPHNHGGVLPRNPLRDLAGWQESVGQIRAALDANHIDPANAFLVAERWDLAAPLAFHLRDLPFLRPTPDHPWVQVLPKDDASLPLAPWPGFDSGRSASAFAGATAIFITDSDSPHVPPQLIRAKWPQAEVIAVFAVSRGGQTLRTIKVFACHPAPAADKSR